MPINLDESYRICEQITRDRAKNFYFAFRTLSRRHRLAICAVYAFCSLCDDIADEDLPLEIRQERISQIRNSLSGLKETRFSDPVFIALSHTSTIFRIPVSYFEEVVEGIELDFVKTRYHNFDELKEYCYKVASVVGLIGIKVFGYEGQSAIGYATDFGLAMQLTNILRDIKEDASRGRIYLPLDEMRSFEYCEEDLISGVTNEQFKSLMRFQISRARKYFDNGRKLMRFLPRRTRACPMILLGIYSTILDLIECADYNVFARRIRLSTKHKFFMVAWIWFKSWTTVKIL